MMKLLTVAKREYLERVRKKSFLVGTIIGPILMGGMIVIPGLLFELTPETQKNVAVIDRTGTMFGEIAAALGDTLPDGRPMFAFREVRLQGRDLGQVKRELNVEVESDVLDGYLIVPEDVVESGKAAFYGKRVGAVKIFERIERGLSNAVIGRRLAGEGMDYGSVKRLIKNVDLETIQLKKGQEKGRSEFGVVYISTFILIMMLYMTILLWGIAVQRSIIEEKNQRVIEVLLSSLTSFDLLAGKVLGVGSVGLTQYGIWSVFAVAVSLYGLSMGAFSQLTVLGWTTLVYFIVFYVLGYLFYSTLFAGIGSVCNTDQEAQQLQTPVVMCLVFTILIPVAVIQNPDGVFATVVSLIPFFAPIVMFMRVNILTPPAWQIALSICILLVSTYLAGQMAAKIFRVGVLMYGKRPNVREIAKWLRRA